MKEFTIEEKARAYDEAIKRAKELLEIGLKDTRDKRVVLSFFPELKESEDMKTKRMLDIITYKMSQHQPDIFTGEENEWFNAWLEKQGEQSSAWSEEDENKVTLFMQLTEGCDNEEELADWLKSLKGRYTWKPSDEQIEALESATENCAYSEYQDCLRELIGQLKKLSGE